MKRKIYLNSTDLKEILPLVQRLVANSSYQVKDEELDTTKTINRITYEAIYAKVSSPCYNAAAMDGITLVASKTYSATETTPVTISKRDFYALFFNLFGFKIIMKKSPNFIF